MTYMVVFQQVVGSPDGGYGIAYDSDQIVHLTRQGAISHGFKTRGSDDFNIAVFGSDGKLCSFDWMDGPIQHDLNAVREGLGLREPA